MSELATKIPPIPPQRFKFALSHWLWWLTITAALFAVHREDMASLNVGEREPQHVASGRLFSKLNGAANLAVVPFHAIAIWAFGLAIWRVSRLQRNFPIQPGHWLAVCFGAYILSREIAWLTFRHLVVPRWINTELQEDFEPLMLLNHLLLDTLSFVVALVVLMAADCCLQAAVRWRAVFWLLTATACAFAVVGCLNTMGFQFFEMTNSFEFVGRCTIPVAAIAISINAAIDCFSNPKPDALHFIGVITAIAAAIHSAMWDLAFSIAFIWAKP
jgi:hypothetical protein